jgi:type I restriction enzyme, R subunit
MKRWLRNDPLCLCVPHADRDHISANLGIDPSDFDYAPFAQEGGLGKVHQLFGTDLNKIIDELNGTLAA